MRPCRLLIFILALLTIPEALYGQESFNLRAYFDATDDEDRDDLLGDLLSASGVERDYRNVDKTAATRAARRSESLEALDLRRNDQDLAASGRTDGATALASVAGVVNSVSIALENGSFTQTTNGTAATIRLKPVAIFNAFAGNSLSPCRRYLVLTSDDTGASCGTAVDKWFKGLSLSVSLDTSGPRQTDCTLSSFFRARWTF